VPGQSFEVVWTSSPRRSCLLHHRPGITCAGDYTSMDCVGGATSDGCSRQTQRGFKWNGEQVKFDSRIAFYWFAGLVLLSGIVTSLFVPQTAGQASSRISAVLVVLCILPLALLLNGILVARQIRIVKERCPGAVVTGFIGRDTTWEVFGRATSSHLVNGVLVATATDVRILRGITDPQLVAIVPNRTILDVASTTGRLGARRKVPRIDLTINMPDGPTTVPFFPIGTGIRIIGTEREDRSRKLGDTIRHQIQPGTVTPIN
jgi:hypothetical protein